MFHYVSGSRPLSLLRQSVIDYMTLEHFLCSQKFLFTDRIQNVAIDVLEVQIEATLT